MDYQKQRSREVAVKAHECLQKLQGSKGSEVDKGVNARFGDSTSILDDMSEKVAESNGCPAEKESPPNIHLKVQRKFRRVLKFTSEKDQFLREGIRDSYSWDLLKRESGK
mgnify:CR=1 FL=1